MINISNEVFTAVKEAVLTVDENAFVTSTYVNAPATFPCVSVIEESNEARRDTADTSRTENHATVMYEVNVYANNSKTKKSDAYALMTVVDDCMQNLGFRRAMLSPIPNYNDATIYRLTARYEAVVSRNETIYYS